MNQKFNNLRIVTALLFLFTMGTGLLAQVKIGDNPTTKNDNSVLELESTNKGLLLPRVALTSTTSYLPLSAHVIGMIVFNSATTGDVIPGYYYNDGGKWVRLADASAASNYWRTNGNSGTTAGTNFIGTTDNIDLVMKANNSEAMRITSSGSVGIGTTPTSKLEVNGAAVNSAPSAGSTSTIDFGANNLALTTYVAANPVFTLSNMKNGGAYTLVLTGTTNSGTATFTASGLTGVRYMNTIALTSGKRHIYSFIVVGGYVYITMATEN